MKELKIYENAVISDGGRFEVVGGSNHPLLPTSYHFEPPALQTSHSYDSDFLKVKLANMS